MSSRSRNSRSSRSRSRISRSKIPDFILRDEPSNYVSKEIVKQFIDEPFVDGSQVNPILAAMTTAEIQTVATHYGINIKDLDIANNDDHRSMAINIIRKELSKELTKDVNLDLIQRFLDNPIIGKTGELSVSPLIMTNRELEMVSRHFKLYSGSVTTKNRDSVAENIIKHLKPKSRWW